MVITFEANATAEQLHAVEAKLRDLGFQVVRAPSTGRVVLAAVGDGALPPLEEVRVMPGVAEALRIPEPFKLASRSFRQETSVIRIGDVEIGGSAVVLMAGPCTIESEEQMVKTAAAVRASGARVLRGGAFKPRTSPYSFQGLGEEGLKILARVREETGLPIVTEVLDTETVELVAQYADCLQVGARNMQNFSLLKKLGRTRKPILLKRGMSATLEELLLSAEYLLAEGNYEVILCERGVRTFSDHTRNTLDLSAVPYVQRISHLPILVDPSHGTGKRQKVLPLSRAAVAVGADGLMIEVHPHPEAALSDGPQALLPEMFAELMRQVRLLAPVVGRTA